MNVKCFFGGILNLILKLITTTDGAETLNTRLIRITMHYSMWHHSKSNMADHPRCWNNNFSCTSAIGVSNGWVIESKLKSTLQTDVVWNGVKI